MYLYALGIYQYDPETGDIHLNKFVQKETINPDIPSQLHDLEDKLIPQSALSLVPHRLYYNDDVIECQYVQRLTDSHLILAIVSRNKIKNKEDLKQIILILNNMANIYLKQTKYNTTLNDLLYNPLLKTDIIVDKINETTDEIKEVMLDNIKKVVKRGDDIDSLLEKSKILHDDTVELEKGAKKLNVCCRW